MKNNCYNNYRLNVWILIVIVSLLHSCGTWSVAPELIGTWKNKKHKITVRTKPKNEPFQFTSDSVIVKIKINNDKTVSGSIGLARFENGKFRKNPSLPWETGVSYIIECGSIGKVFNNDPLNAKEVEIWLGPLKEKMEAELRYTQGWAHFPMAHIIFSKEED